MRRLSAPEGATLADPGFHVEEFELDADAIGVANWGDSVPKSLWRPDALKPLDEVLPRPWPPRYLREGQHFAPSKFMLNSFELCNYAAAPEEEGAVRSIVDALVERMLEHSTLVDGARYIVYGFPKRYRGMVIEPPWTSGYASGAVLGGLSRLIARYGDEFRPLADEFFAGMARLRVARGQADPWTTFIDTHGYVWFEEIPLPHDPQPRILNGHIRGITGVYHHWRMTGDEAARTLLLGALTTVKHYGPRYRRPGRINSYELRNPNVPDYGPKRTWMQQQELHAITGDAVFGDLAEQFASDHEAALRRGEAKGMRIAKDARRWSVQDLLMPPGRATTYRIYRMNLLSDGFPGAPPKNDPEGDVHPHPLYGTYLIRDSLAAFRKTEDEGFLRQALRTAEAALDRMTAHGPALVFEYDADSPFNNQKRTYVSALTQARYLEAFDWLHTATGNPKWSEAAEAVLSSFEVPVSEGGVAVRRPAGLGLEEMPHAVPSFILNGWLSVLQILDRYAKSSGSEHARELIGASVPLLCELLPRYDVPKLRNSRYRLAGPLPFELRLTGGAKGRVRRARLRTPLQDPVPFAIGRKRESSWDVSLEGERIGAKPVAGNLILSQETAKATIVDVVLSADGPGELELLLPQTSYDPVRGTVTSKDRTVYTSEPVERGKQRILLRITPAHFPDVAPPTTWRKPFPGGRYNRYHFMHVEALQALGDSLGEPELRKWGELWESYARNWHRVPAYDRRDITLGEP